MKYIPIGVNEDGSTTVRMFMDDGNTYDQIFTVRVPTLEEVVDATVAPVMQQLEKEPPTQEKLDDPAEKIYSVATPDKPADIPESGVEVKSDLVKDEPAIDVVPG